MDRDTDAAAARRLEQAFADAVWQSVLARGLAGLVFGALALLWPGAAARVLPAVLGAWLLLDALLALPLLARLPGGLAQRFAWGLMAVLQAVAGGVALLLPGLAAIWLALMVGLWLLFTGALNLVLIAFAGRRPDGKVWAAVGTSLAVLGGLLVWVDPAAAAAALAMLGGAAACVLGLLVALLGLWLRSRARAALAARDAAP